MFGMDRWLHFAFSALLLGAVPSAIRAAPYIYLADYGAPGTMTVLDAATGEVAKRFSVGGSAYVIGLSVDQRLLFVRNSDADTILEIDTRTNGVVKTLGPGIGASEVATSPANPSRAYFVRGGISVVDTVTGDVLKTLRVPAPYLGYFVDVQVSPDGNRIYASDYFDNVVFVFDAHSYALVTKVTGILDATTLALSPDGSRLYVISFASSVVTVDTSTFNIIGSVKFYAGGGLDADEMVASPDGNFVYVANVNSLTVAKIDIRDNTVVNVPVSDRPFGLSVSADGALVYARGYSGEVQALSRDAASAARAYAPVEYYYIGRNFVGEPPPIVYVGNGAATQLSVVDSSTNSVLAGSDVGGAAGGVAVVPGGSTAYVSVTGENRVAVVDVATGASTTISVGQSPAPIAVSPDGHRVYVANQGDKSVSVIDTGVGAVVATVMLSGYAQLPTAIAVAPDGALVYVAAGREVAVIDAATNLELPALDQFASICGLAVSADGTSLFVTMDEDDFIRQIALPTHAIVSEVFVGPTGPSPIHYGPCALTVSPDGSRDYVVNKLAGSLSIVGNYAHDLVKIVPVGANPSAVGVTPDGRHVYVANAGSDSVSVVSGATLGIEKTLFGFSDPNSIGNVVEPQFPLFTNGFE